MNGKRSEVNYYSDESISDLLISKPSHKSVMGKPEKRLRVASTRCEVNSVSSESEELH